MEADVDAAVAEEDVALLAPVEGRRERHVVHLEQTLYRKQTGGGANSSGDFIDDIN